MKVGRNDPCPCGSGKKYKKCCMDKERVEEREEIKIIPAPSPQRQKTWADFEHLKVYDSIDHDEFDEDEDEEEEEKKFVDPRQISLFGEDEFPQAPQQSLELADDEVDVEAAQKRWDEFEEASYEKKIAIYLITLEEKELMDKGMAFDMLSTIYPEAIEKKQRERFTELIKKLKAELPKIYESHAVFYLDWMIDLAVIESRHDDVISLLNEMAPKASQDIDIFNENLDRLAYHGYQSPLFDAMKNAWKNIERSPDIVPWGIDQFANRIVNFAVFEYIDTHPAQINPNDLELLKTVTKFVPSLTMKEFIKYVEHVSGKVKGQWILEDFDPKSKHLRSQQKKRPKVLARENLYYLSLDFLYYLRQEENVPFSKGQMAQQQLLDYFAERSKGELVEKPGFLDKRISPRKNKPKKQPTPEHILCPDAATLNVFLARFLSFIEPEHHGLAATVELIPAWLRFLEARQLLDKDLHEQAINEIKENLIGMLLNIYDHAVTDPFLRQNLERIWQV